MKKAAYLSIIISILTSSCNNLTPINPVTNPGNGVYSGSWTFEGNTYLNSVLTTANNSMTATSGSPPSGSISVFFPGSTLPTITDTITTYTVVNTRPVGNQVNIRLTTNGGNTIYAARGENDSIWVSRVLTSVASTSGKNIRIEGGGIEMFNISNPSDSAPLTLDIMIQ